jgi:hypothetical protein
MDLADVLTKAVPVATFEPLLKLCLESKRGKYFVTFADEKVNYVSDEKTWMVCVSLFCVSLFYVIDTGSTGSRRRTWGLPVYPPPLL